MITELLRKLIEYTITNADIESKRTHAAISYVKNDNFPLGVFRVPLNYFLPGYMCTNAEILEELHRLCVEEYSQQIHFDVPSAWITIKG